MNPPMVELGAYQLPDSLLTRPKNHVRYNLIGPEFPFHTPHGWELRTQNYDMTSAPLSWHQDCGGTESALIVWSNVNPTQVRLKKTGLILPTKPGVVYLIDNQACEHRAPPDVDRTPDRYFLRTRFTPYWPDDEFIATWRKELQAHRKEQSHA